MENLLSEPMCLASKDRMPDRGNVDIPFNQDNVADKILKSRS